MRVIHLSTYSSKGGAAIAASRCVETLSRNGINCSLLTSENANLVSPYTRLRSLAFNRIELRLANMLETSHPILQSYGLLGAAGQRLINYINASDFDLVHIHWVQGGFLSIKQISHINKPIVWHLHDLWPLSSLGHYPKAITDADPSNIAQIIQDEVSESSFIGKKSFLLKRNLIKEKNITFISPSKWISDLASPLLSESLSCSVEIPFPFVLKANQTLLCESNNTILNDQYDIKICIGGSGYFGNALKGASDALAIFELLGKENIRALIICFGGHPPEQFKRRILRYHFLVSLGNINQRTLISYLQQSDLYLSTSWLESYGLIIEESLSVGTPCIAYQNTGSESIINQMIDGICLPYKDISATVRLIIKLVKNPSELARLKLGAKNRMSSNKIFLSEIKKVYTSLISSRNK